MYYLEELFQAGIFVEIQELNKSLATLKSVIIRKMRMINQGHDYKSSQNLEDYFVTVLSYCSVCDKCLNMVMMTLT